MNRSMLRPLALTALAVAVLAAAVLAWRAAETIRDRAELVLARSGLDRAVEAVATLNPAPVMASDPWDGPGAAAEGLPALIDALVVQDTVRADLVRRATAYREAAETLAALDAGATAELVAGFAASWNRVVNRLGGMRRDDLAYAGLGACVEQVRLTLADRGATVGLVHGEALRFLRLAQDAGQPLRWQADAAQAMRAHVEAFEVALAARDARWSAISRHNTALDGLQDALIAAAGRVASSPDALSRPLGQAMAAARGASWLAGAAGLVLAILAGLAWRGWARARTGIRGLR